jgi:hypothetical protein
MRQFYDGKTQKGLAYFRQVILKRSGRAGIAAIDHKFFRTQKAAIFPFKGWISFLAR